MIILSGAQYETIREYVFKGLPEEVCGLMGGVEKGGAKLVKKLYFAENIMHSCARFEIDNAFQLWAVKDMRKLGYIPLGNFHSHPNGRSKPSCEDEYFMCGKNVSYIIAAVSEEINLKSFCVSNGVLKEEKLIII